MAGHGRGGKEEKRGEKGKRRKEGNRRPGSLSGT